MTNDENKTDTPTEAAESVEQKPAPTLNYAPVRGNRKRAAKFLYSIPGFLMVICQQVLMQLLDRDSPLFSWQPTAGGNSYAIMDISKKCLTALSLLAIVFAFIRSATLIALCQQRKRVILKHTRVIIALLGLITVNSITIHLLDSSVTGHMSIPAIVILIALLAMIFAAYAYLPKFKGLQEILVD